MQNLFQLIKKEIIDRIRQRVLTDRFRKTFIAQTEGECNLADLQLKTNRTTKNSKTIRSHRENAPIFVTALKVEQKKRSPAQPKKIRFENVTTNEWRIRIGAQQNGIITTLHEIVFVSNRFR